MSILNYTQLLPKQFYVEAAVDVMKKELLDECDYIREAQSNRKFAELIESRNDTVFVVPKVHMDLTTKQILVCEYIYGQPFDQCFDLPQEQKNYVNSIAFFFFAFLKFEICDHFEDWL